MARRLLEWLCEGVCAALSQQLSKQLLVDRRALSPRHLAGQQEPHMLPRVTETNRHLGVLARIALLVAAGDWLTKAVAARFIGNEALVFSERLRFAVVHNDAGAFGLSAGPYTWQLNLALTLAAIVLMIPVARDLSRIDAAAPRALGLIVGGAVGNLASLILSPAGVVDFIAINFGAHSGLVLNVADLAAYVGLAMMTRTAFLIVAEMRRTVRPNRVPQVSHWVTVARRAFVDREVKVPVPMADRVVPESDLVVPRPESVRRTELLDLEVTDPKVIDIRPHLAAPRPEVKGQRLEMQRFVWRERAD
jgi:lipoprotein signal peptidase